MTDYQTARTNMVDCQIHTSGIIVPGILEAFETVPREMFVPEALHNAAYNDEDIKLGHGRFLLEPVVHAKMIQALELTADDVILDIGCATGYSSTILSSLVSTVVAIESDETFLELAARIWDALDVRNVVGVNAALQDGNPKNAPYDSIIINGAVESVPQNLIDQLTEKGRLVAVVKKPGHVMGEATLMKKTPSGGISKYSLFEAGTPYLQGFEPTTTFQF